MWVLVLITLTGSAPDAQAHSLYTTMADCFDGRDQLLVDGSHYNGQFPRGVQAICMQVL